MTHDFFLITWRQLQSSLSLYWRDSILIIVVQLKLRAIQTKQNAESMKARRDRKQTMCRHPNYKVRRH
ncbi:hypothetical protein OIU78_009498 [Salix suchowensis]|nr:hypothetical protein OIU78_009498 [Salix suchowensis]